MLQAQMKMSSAMKDENKRLLFKLEEKKDNYRYRIIHRVVVMNACLVTVALLISDWISLL